ncbi:MAG TPA: DUF3105 domain-containing protein [Acidimicrobiales bacterium]
MIRRCAAALLAVLTLAAGACGSDGDGDAGPDASGGGRATSGGELIGPAGEGIEGVLAYRVASNTHTEHDLTYDLTPPVGGEHFPVPATCGFYDSDVPPDEMLVHDLEHGGIWVAFDPDLDDAQIAALSQLVAQQAKVVATPRDGLDSPVVVSAWARQLPLDRADDPRLQQFIDMYRNSANAPEPQAACQGTGEPSVASPAA